MWRKNSPNQVLNCKCDMVSMSVYRFFWRPELNLVNIFFTNTAGRSNTAAYTFVSNIAVRITKLFYRS